MKSLRSRYIQSCIWLLLFSLAGVLLVSAATTLLLLVTEWDGLSQLWGAIKAFLHGSLAGPERFVPLFLIWSVLVVLVVIICCLAVSHRLYRTTTDPIIRLKAAASRMEAGDLDFDIEGGEDKEIYELCSSFESIRQRLKKNARREVEQQEERNLLLANLSHDMRTPVTTIRGYAEGLMDGIASTPEKQKAYLDTIYKKSLVLENLLDSLSEYAELELDHLQYHFDKTDLRPFFMDLTEGYAVEVEEAGRQFESGIGPEPMPVIADLSKLQRVFDNVMGNALKYTPEGGKIFFRAGRGEKGVLVRISDSGSGISEADIDKIFDVFYRSDKARTGSKGHGLGLAIAKQIAEDHRGKIWIKSENGQGTDVYLYLPLRTEE